MLGFDRLARLDIVVRGRAVFYFCFCNKFVLCEFEQLEGEPGGGIC